MPTYEFRCPNGHDFDRFFKTISTAASEVECPECGQMAKRQLSAGAGLLFKGSGFYLTDYGKNAHRAGGAPKGGEKSGEGKSESAKPESKAETSKADAPKADATPKAESPKKADSPKPKSDK